MIDANVAIWSVLPVVGDPIAAVRGASWQRSGLPLTAPGLWLPEATTGIRRARHARAITPSEAIEALEELFSLGVQLLPMTHDHARAALDWAARIHQSRAYDAFYLTLAEDLGTDFWTADRRLANAAQAAGVSWAYWIGEPA